MSQHNRKVLIIDDSPDDRMIIRRYLTENILQYSEILEAATVSEAKQHILEHTPGCMILDYRIGMDNGVDFLEECQTHTEWHNPEIVFLTGFGDYPALEQRVKALGVDTFLSKDDLTENRICAKVSKAILAST